MFLSSLWRLGGLSPNKLQLRKPAIRPVFANPVTYIDKTLVRAQDPRANGAWLSKTNWMKHEVFILGGQRIDQKSKRV